MEGHDGHALFAALDVDLFRKRCNVVLHADRLRIERVGWSGKVKSFEIYRLDRLTEVQRVDGRTVSATFSNPYYRCPLKFKKRDEAERFQELLSGLL